MFLFLFLLLLTTHAPVTHGFDYVLSPRMNPLEQYKIRLVDVTTNVSDIPTIFQLANASVHVDGIQWQSAIPYTTELNSTERQTAQLQVTTYLKEEIIHTTLIDLSQPGTVPPDSIMAGFVQVEQMGRVNLTVALQVIYNSESENSTTTSNIVSTTPLVSTSRMYQVYWPMVTLVPVLVLCGLAYLTGNVEISISTANLVSVIIAQGDFFRGMEHLVYGGFLGALTNTYNGVIMLLVFFLCGIISLVEVTGGSKGWVRLIARFVGTTRVVQCLAFALGISYFWDDVLSILLVGHLMRPLLDVAHTSRPLGALILDATGGPMAGIVMISTWLVWEIPLLQQELARIDNLSDDSSGAIPALTMTPWQVLKESLRYAFYPILYLILMPLLLWSQRHLGQMLMYERVTQVYQSKRGGPKDIRGPCQPNLPPPKNTPCRFWNALIPFCMISILFIAFWFQAGGRGAKARHESEIPESEEWIVTAYAYAATPQAWLQAISMGAAVYVVSILLQFQQGDNILFLPCSLKLLWNQHKLRQQQQHGTGNSNGYYYDGHHHQSATSTKENEILVLENDAAEPDRIMRQTTSTDEEDDNNTKKNHNTTTTTSKEQQQLNEIMRIPQAKPLLAPMDLIASFFFGFGRIMPYMIQFILAWALRTSFTEMGLDRWFASLLGDNLDVLQTQYIPIAAFLTAFLMSLATGGAARGKVASILLPMIVVPVYQRTHNSTQHDDMIFQVIGAVLSGCMAGDHAAPLSNTTLLSCLASDCHILVHVLTQIPYIAVVFVLSLLFGTGPVGYGIYPVGAGYFLGVVCIIFFVFFICYPILDPSGQWDLLTRMYIRCCVRKRRNNNNNNPKSSSNNNNKATTQPDGQQQDVEDPVIMRREGEEEEVQNNAAAAGSNNHRLIDNLNDDDDDDDDDEDEGNFWEILQRDTIRAANAIAHGLPYETEDCRHLMQPIDSAITKDYNEEGGATSSSCEDDDDDDNNGNGNSNGAGDGSQQQLQPPHVTATMGTLSIEEHHNGGRPVRIIASDARGGQAHRSILNPMPTTPTMD